MDMMFQLITRIFEIARAKEDEIEAMCAITLIISMLESVKGIEHTLQGILQYFVKELQTAKTPDF